MTKGAKLRVKRTIRTGRPRVDGKRYPCGEIIKSQQVRQETPEQVMAVATAAPHRRLFSDKRSPLAGSSAGRLYAARVITQPQFKALERYSRLSVRYMRDVMGRTVTWPCMSIERTDKGRSEWEPEEDDIWKLREDHSEAMRAIQDAGDFAVANRLLFSVGVLDKDHHDGAEIGTLRCALNALARLWGLTDSANRNIRETQNTIGTPG